MPDYRNMSATQALRYAKEISGLTVERIAQGSGISVPVLRRYFQQQEGYMPGLDRIAPLCLAMKNRVIVDWLLAQFEEEPETGQAASRADVLDAVARAQASLGDCQRHLADCALAGVRPADAREIRSILKDAGLYCASARAMLASLAGGFAKPLASVKKKKFGQRLLAWIFRSGDD